MLHGAGVVADVRVAIDVGALHGPRTGVGNAVAWTVEALSAEAAVELLPYVVSMRAKVRRDERRLPVPAALALRLWAHRSPALDRWVGSPDVVHGTNYIAPPTNCPRLISVYDCWFLDHPDDAVADVQRAGAVLRRAVQEGAHVITSSDATTRRVRDLLDTERVRTVPLGPPRPLNGSDSSHLRRSAASRTKGLPELADQPFFLALGTLERRKNLPSLIAAFRRVANEHEGVRLVIAGAAGNDVATITRAIGRLEPAAAERIVRTGPVDGPTKSWLLTNARALVYPSLDEGFGFPILEAQQAGTPVVASTAGSIPQVAGAAALLSPPLDTEALAANLYWVLTNDEMHAKLVRRGHSNVARFSWAATADALTNIYRELAAA
jgi:glycosyltransferase involved in cell wall biosynthesis